MNGLRDKLTKTNRQTTKPFLNTLATHPQKLRDVHTLSEPALSAFSATLIMNLHITWGLKLLTSKQSKYDSYIY